MKKIVAVLLFMLCAVALTFGQINEFEVVAVDSPIETGIVLEVQDVLFIDPVGVHNYSPQLFVNHESVEFRQSLSTADYYDTITSAILGLGSISARDGRGVALKLPLFGHRGVPI